MNHIIKKQILTIDMPSGYDTWRMQDSFKEVFNRDVLPRLEKVCDELGLDKRVSLKLDKLTIDTGTISSQELSIIWADQIENEFRKELLSHQQEKFDKEQVKNLTKNNQSELEAFIHFLEKGVLPWWVSDEFRLNPEQLLEQLLTKQPKELVSQIGKSKRKSSISKRLVYQFEPRQLKRLLKHFTAPETKQVLKCFESICKRAFKTKPKSLQSALLATEIAITIDQNLIRNDTEKLFKLLFSHLKNQQSGATNSGLLEIHKALIYSNKERKTSLSLEEKRVLSIALKVISKQPALQEGSENFHSTNARLKTRSTAENINDESGNSNQRQPANQESPDQKKSEKPTDKANAGSPLEEPLSVQDKRAWEHIERIKRLQLAKLNQEKKDEVATDKPDASYTSVVDNGQEDQRVLPSPAQASAPLHHRGQEAGSSTETRPGTEATPMVKEAAEKSQQKGRKSASQNRLEPKTTEGQQDHKKLLNLPEQEETQTKADNIEQQNAADNTRQAVPDHTKSIKPDQQTSVDKTLRDNTIAPESPEESQLLQGEDGNRAYQVKTSGKQAPTSARADDKAVDHQSTLLKVDNPDRPDSPSPVNQVSIKPDQHTLTYWQEELESIDECYIRNAGLILFWPYLGHFFKDVGLTTEGAFQSVSNQKQAVLLLQYLLNSDPELHEYRLPLNKLLCGLKISEPVGRSIDPTEEDLTRCNNLLEATIKNWSALRGTSVEGFQTSFLQRNGVLKRKDKHWLLQVEKMPFDMLMEQLPWPIGIVRLSWMNKPIYVEW